MVNSQNPLRTIIACIMYSGIFLSGGCSSPATKGNGAQESSSARGAGSKWEGQMIRRPGSTPEDGKIFIVSDGTRHWVISAKWLTQHGYNFPQDVHVISAEALAQIPEGNAIQ